MAGGKKARSGHRAEDGPRTAPSSLPEHLRTQHTHTTCGVDVNFNTQTASSATRYMSLGVDNSWVHADWKRAFRIAVTSISGNDIDFDMAGLDPSIANAFRRILIAETPTMAIEHVFYIDNTSIIPDEVMAHRLGLVPIRMDPAHFEWKAAEETSNEKNTVVFKLEIACRREANGLVNDKVYSSALEWLAEGSEMPEETNCRFVGSQAEALPQKPRPVHSDILLAKMRPGQAIELEAHCIKGIGREHAKWSPVATAWYKLLPELHMLEDITGADADELAAALPGLVSVVGSRERRKAVAAPAREHDLLLEKARRLAGEERWEGRIALLKRKDYFLFTIQSTGVLPPDVLFMQAVDGLAAKADKLLQHL